METCLDFLALDEETQLQKLRHLVRWNCKRKSADRKGNAIFRQDIYLEKATFDDEEGRHYDDAEELGHFVAQKMVCFHQLDVIVDLKVGRLNNVHCKQHLEITRRY